MEIDELSSMREACEYFGISSRRFFFFAYNKFFRLGAYSSFEIPKRNNGFRTIEAPRGDLKELQIKILELLRRKVPHSCSHAYTQKKSIITNASKHLNNSFFLKIDLKDFFPSITARRVYGFFKNYLKIRDGRLCHGLTQIVTYNSSLPQGAPTSPLISNLICFSMDQELYSWARANHCNYTRYADDIVFSTIQKNISQKLFRPVTRNINSQIESIIRQNGFEINQDKVFFIDHLEKSNSPVMITGLNVSSSHLNWRRSKIKTLRFLISLWYKSNLTQLASFYESKLGNDYKLRLLQKRSNNDKREYNKLLKSYLREKIIGQLQFLGQVTNWGDQYQKLGSKLLKCDEANFSSHHIDLQYIQEKYPKTVVIHVEGQTDSLHIECALNKFYRQKPRDLKYEFKVEGSDSQVISFIRNFQPNNNPTNQLHIAILDGDLEDKNQKFVANEDLTPKKHTGRLYSMILPKPDFRSGKFCIEMLYDDLTISRCDESGNRLFLKNEFNDHNLHKEFDQGRQFFYQTGHDKSERNSMLVYEAGVYDLIRRRYVSLSKIGFFHKIIEPNKKEINFDAFKPIIDTINKLARETFK
jgi:RNA-directed DNA polymerase